MGILDRQTRQKTPLYKLGAVVCVVSAKNHFRSKVDVRKKVFVWVKKLNEFYSIVGICLCGLIEFIVDRSSGGSMGVVWIVSGVSFLIKKIF